MTAWLKRHPLGLFLPLQALIYSWNLSLLSPWFDEADQMLFMRTSLARAVAIPASGGHPPLYFVLTYGWLRLPLGLSWTVQSRTLSVLFALAATFALDRLWGRRLEPSARLWLLALWTLSPFLLLYSRMARSYSLQLLIGTADAACIWLLVEKGTGRWKTGGVLALAMYIHYIPGISLLTAANLGLLRKRRLRDLAAVDAVVAIAFLPWAWKLARSLEMWSTGGKRYALTGSLLLELPLKLAYWAISWTMGEAVPDPVLLAGLAVLALAGVLIVAGAVRRRDLAWIAVPAAVVGFAGVAQWVSYPFIPARMIFLFPLVLLLLIEGAMDRPRLGRIVLAAMLLLSLSGIWCYFHRIGFRNKQYPMPIDAIAGTIRANSTAADSLILADSANSDPPAMKYALGPTRPIIQTEEPDAPAAMARALADPQIRTVWFLRNTHDVSKGALDRRFEDELRARMHATVYNYEPFSPLESRLMRAMGMHDPPSYFHELLEFQR